ncbi:MAG: PKD domain-containing protein [Actinobacteria bacterium]|nr:PKD domain-containing protein [Actinomycetota bacterium]
MRTTLRSRGTSLIAAATAVAVAALLLVCAASAPAATFCVNVSGCAGGPGNNYGTLGAALTAASGSSGTDRVEIASGTYSGPFTLGSTNPVDIVGVGATRPTLTAPAVNNSLVLTMNADGSSLKNVAIAIPAADGNTGLRLDKWTSVDGVSVTGAGSTNAIGISVSSHNSSILTGLDVNLDWGSGNDSTALSLYAANSAKVYNSSLRGCTAVAVDTSNNVDLQRLRTIADNGVFFWNSSGTLSSSLLRYSTPALKGYHYGLRVNNTSGATQTVYSANNTIAANGANIASGVVSSASSPGTNNFYVNSNAITGLSASAFVDGTGTNNVSVSYSRYDVAPPLAVGASNALLTGDFGFTDAAGGDYSLRRSSSLVDAGDPGTISTGVLPIPSALDLAGENREVNAIGTDAAARDIGAYEVQNAAPVAAISVLTPNPSTSAPVSFSSAGSSEPDGDAVSYLWSFDDGTTISTPNAQRLWNVAGIQTVRLTVTDSTGLSNTASVQVRIDQGNVVIALPRTSAKVDRSGAFKYKVTCPAEAAVQCSGTVTFVTSSKVDLKSFATASAKRKIKAGQLVFTVRSGASKTFSVRTYRTFQKVLKRERKVSLSATLTGSAANVSLSGGPSKFTVKR